MGEGPALLCCAGKAPSGQGLGTPQDSVAFLDLTSGSTASREGPGHQRGTQPTAGPPQCWPSRPSRLRRRLNLAVTSAGPTHPGQSYLAHDPQTFTGLNLKKQPFY